MRTKLCLLLFCVAFASMAFSQDTLNRLDANGKKNGKWIMYYDKYCNVVKDSQKASYYCYADYIHGRRYITKSPWGGKKWKLVDSGVGQQQSKIKLLDGKYTWYTEKGQPADIHYYIKGELVYRKWFYPSGKLRVLMDYTKQYQGQPHSGYLYTYDEKGNLTYSSPIFIFKDKKGNYEGGVI